MSCYGGSMLKLALLGISFVTLAAACNKDDKADPSDSPPKAAEPANPNEAAEAPPTPSAERADWSEHLAGDPCLLSEAQVAEALGLEVSKKEVIDTMCKYSVGDGWASIRMVAMEPSVIDGYVAKIPEQIESGPYTAVELADNIPATQRGPLVQLWTKTHQVDVSGDVPRFDPAAEKEGRDEIRAAQADNALKLSKALVHALSQ